MEALSHKREMEEMEDSFDEADAALVLTSISCSPPSGMSILRNELQKGHPGQTLSCSLPADVGLPLGNLSGFKSEHKTKYFQCLWKQPKCSFTTTSQEEISQHVRSVHLSHGRLLRDRRNNMDAMHVDGNDSITEEDFYYTEVDVDVMDSFVNSFRHLQTASPPDASSPVATSSSKSSFIKSQNSPDSAYGSVPTSQERQHKNTCETAIPMQGEQRHSDLALFSQSLPSQAHIGFTALNNQLGLNAEIPTTAATPNLEAAFLSVLKQMNHNSSEKDQNANDLSTSLPSGWLFPAQQFPPHTGGGGVPFHVIASAVANNNTSTSSDPNLTNSICMSSSPPSTNSPSPPPHGIAGSLPVPSTLKHHRRIRSDVKKCRKVYGVEKRDLWCTQCRWKKACTRFME